MVTDNSNEGKVVIPGDVLLDSAENIRPGKGTYELHGRIYASLAGYLYIRVENQNEKKIQVVEVRRIEEKQEHVVPYIGGIVTARVANIGTRFAKCDLLCVEESPLSSEFSAVLRKEDLVAATRDQVNLAECVQPGDVILARVISFGDSQSSFVLSTAEDQLGVVCGVSEAGDRMIPKDWTSMKGVVSGSVEPRKVAQVPVLSVLNHYFWLSKLMSLRYTPYAFPVQNANNYKLVRTYTNNSHAFVDTSSNTLPSTSTTGKTSAPLYFEQAPVRMASNSPGPSNAVHQGIYPEHHATFVDYTDDRPETPAFVGSGEPICCGTEYQNMKTLVSEALNTEDLNRIEQFSEWLKSKKSNLFTFACKRSDEFEQDVPTTTSDIPSGAFPQKERLEVPAHADDWVSPRRVVLDEEQSMITVYRTSTKLVRKPAPSGSLTPVNAGSSRRIGIDDRGSPMPERLSVSISNKPCDNGRADRVVISSPKEVGTGPPLAKIRRLNRPLTNMKIKTVSELHDSRLLKDSDSGTDCLSASERLHRQLVRNGHVSDAKLSHLVNDVNVSCAIMKQHDDGDSLFAPFALTTSSAEESDKESLEASEQRVGSSAEVHEGDVQGEEDEPMTRLQALPTNAIAPVLQKASSVCSDFRSDGGQTFVGHGYRRGAISIPPRGAMSLRVINGKRFVGKNNECYAYAEDKCKAGIFCRYEHNGSLEHHQRRVCSRLLQGKCRLDVPQPSCSSHEYLLPHQVPICQFFLNMDCTAEECSLLHVKHTPGTKPCEDFQKGVCFNGDDCDFPHRYMFATIKTFGAQETDSSRFRWHSSQTSEGSGEFENSTGKKDGQLLRWIE